MKYIVFLINSEGQIDDLWEVKASEVESESFKEFLKDKEEAFKIILRESRDL